MNENHMTFEEAMEKLDGALKALESGNLSLDVSLKAYEQAIGLLRFCHSAIETAEQRVSVLLEGEGGILKEAPFAQTDEA